MNDHRVQRARERYGVELTQDDLMRIDLLPSPSNRLKSDANGDTHAITYRGICMIVVVKPLTNGRVGVVTFLPQDAFTQANRKSMRPPQWGKPKRNLGIRRPDADPLSRSQRQRMAVTDWE